MPPLVVADVVDDVVAAQVLEPLRAVDHVGADHVVAHHLDAEIAAGLDDAPNRFLVGPRHDHDVRAPALAIISASR